MHATGPLRALSAAAVLLVALSSGCARGEDPPPQATGEQAAGEYERGPHGGRLLRDGEFAVEITIFEEGVPPEFHVFGYDDGEPLPPGAFDVTIELSRLGGRQDRFLFRPSADFQRGAGVVYEPHSFDVRVEAQHEGRRSQWSYASYEGRTRIASEVAAASGIETEVAGPATVREQIELSGVIGPRTDRQAQVRARFAGVVRSVTKGVGDAVAPGELLARVQSNESLEEYDVRAPLRGVVLSLGVAVGEVAGAQPLMVIADLRDVWVELDAFARDVPRLRAGQPVTVVDLDGVTSATGKLSRIAPQALHASQSVRARVDLPNPDGKWRPGQFVRGLVTVSESEVPLAVRVEALQGFRDFTVVFAQVGDTYEVRMLELGRRDGEWVEVLGGLEAGERYVTANSFLVKADIEKSGASHDH